MTFARNPGLAFDDTGGVGQGESGHGGGVVTLETLDEGMQMGQVIAADAGGTDQQRHGKSPPPHGTWRTQLGGRATDAERRAPGQQGVGACRRPCWTAGSSPEGAGWTSSQSRGLNGATSPGSVRRSCRYGR
ncbi:hypothetical protein GCM10022419_133650 [Nonomuraea rosea]|uniref:Uncharacterized protein n=1 Tax=Nonomuraea rosea TaxID=638574 RepID=A0ABP7A5G2_9ACTN